MIDWMSKACIKDNFDELLMVQCNLDDPSLRWQFQNYTDHYTALVTGKYNTDTPYLQTLAKIINAGQRNNMQELEQILKTNNILPMATTIIP